MKSKSVSIPTNSPSKTKGRPDEFDAYIGYTLKTLRVMKGVTQNDLARLTGITFQQIQKYETGANRISASRLYRLSAILGIKITDFFEGYEETKDTTSFWREIEKDKELVSLVRGWQCIQNKELKKNMLKVLSSFIEAEEKA